MTHFTLGAIDYNTDVADADGNYWYGRTDGWDAMTNRVEETARPHRHGGITLSNLYEPRQMTLFGTAVCEDSVGYYKAKNRIVNETNSFTRFTSPALFLIHNEDVRKRMSVVRTGIQMTCIEERYLQFEVTFRADDPLKYAAAAKFLTTSGTITNTGNATTYPRFTTSAAGTPTLTLGARTVSATAPLPSGTIIDFDTLIVSSAGTNYFGSMNPDSDFFGLVPGDNAVTSNVAGTWRWRDAWL